MRKISEYQIEWSGLENRLAQMFNPLSGHTVMLAVDHGYFQGAPEGLINLRKTIEPLLPYCDAISPTIGGLKTSISPWTRTPIILRATGGNSMAKTKEIEIIVDEEGKEIGVKEEGKEYTVKVKTEKKKIPIDLDDEIVTVSIDEILRANAIGFTASAYIGLPHQKQTIGNLTSLANEAHKYGLIAIGITAVGNDPELNKFVTGEKEGGGELTEEDKKKAVRYLKHASRLLSENGAVIIKTYHCEGFEEVVESCLSPIVIAGGTKKPTKEALEFTYNAIKAGAVGVDMGRNIFQNEHPVAMIRAVRAIVHEGYTVEEAYAFYQKLSSEKTLSL